MEFDLKKIRKKIEEIKEQYQGYLSDETMTVSLERELAVLNEWYEHGEKLDRLEERCQNALTLVEQQKKHILEQERVKPTKTTKKPILVGVKEEKKPEDKTDELLQKKDELDEIMLAKMMIEEHMKEQQQLIVDVKRQVNQIPIKRKKKTLFQGFGSMIYGATKLAVSLFPISFFRNRILGGVTSALMLNYSVRSLRKPFMYDTRQLEQGYQTLYRQLQTRSDSLEYYQSICVDSLEQITRLKQELVQEFGSIMFQNSEIEKIFMEVDDLERSLSCQQDILLNYQDETEHQKQKVKRNNI